MTAVTLPLYAGGFFANSTDQGVSPDAKLIRETLMDVLRSFHETSYIRHVHEPAHQALLQVVADSSVDNWDGYGSSAVSAVTARKATYLLRSLPSTVPSPEVSADPDGEIAFEWHAAPRRAFSISVGEGDKITFAAVHGRRTLHGTDFLIDGLPDTVLQELGRTLVD